MQISLGVIGPQKIVASFRISIVIARNPHHPDASIEHRLYLLPQRHAQMAVAEDDDGVWRILSADAQQWLPLPLRIAIDEYGAAHGRASRILRNLWASTVPCHRGALSLSRTKAPVAGALSSFVTARSVFATPPAVGDGKPSRLFSDLRPATFKGNRCEKPSARTKIDQWAVRWSMPCRIALCILEIMLTLRRHQVAGS
jgi:hypothetical protein